MVGLCLTVLGVEVQGVGWQWTGVRPIVDVVIEAVNGPLAFIGHRNACMPSKRHGEKGVQAFITTDRKHLRLPIVVGAQAQSKEIANRCLNTGFCSPSQ